MTTLRETRIDILDAPKAAKFTRASEQRFGRDEQPPRHGRARSPTPSSGCSTRFRGSMRVLTEPSNGSKKTAVLTVCGSWRRCSRTDRSRAGCSRARFKNLGSGSHD